RRGEGRDEGRGAEPVAEIRERGGNGGVWGYRADLASLDGVEELGDGIVDERARLDALVNNAGIGTSLPGNGERLVSSDGHELRFAVNYLAPYALTRRLLPLVAASAPARIVNVSSAGQAPIDFDDVMLEHGYS